MCPAMDCKVCGTSLMAEAFAGPPRVWFATAQMLTLLAERFGWRDGVCRECQED